MIRALVIDDETIIAEDLALQLCERVGWQADHCSDPTHVLGTVKQQAYNVCFLDIEMPGQGGLQLAESIREIDPNMIILFATAYAEHAATAYRLPAADYLVKPISAGILDEACCRVEALHKTLQASGDALDKTTNLIAVKSVGRTDYIKPANIIMGQAAGNYVRLHCRDKEYLHRCSFNELAAQLEPQGFLKCHRSFFVKANKVVSFIRTLNDGDELILEGGQRAPVSQSHRKAIDEILSGSKPA